jgi:hypothetical protein
LEVKNILGEKGVHRNRGRVETSAVKEKWKKLSQMEKKWITRGTIGELMASSGPKVAGTLLELCKKERVEDVKLFYAYPLPPQLAQMERVLLGRFNFKLGSFKVGKIKIFRCELLISALQERFLERER